ncbi:uncharacterized protein K452DRAFT_231648 [Aplosporella prunicola CBS 121167]|uniref:DNA helicase n=1 Tax=Aplosporella prunicola CBS 121167 TaxID=1176127 RepID=A0A6A6BAJ1_9PEZI|nr:uncharacterized protein K452DRAFT_231648 [Aplosporella prunicola CBS 121167]KAF2139927.1 hypothetical protein K452DRAFT_231648 [Aplosporella prunicola CBS 121167]
MQNTKLRESHDNHRDGHDALDLTPQPASACTNSISRPAQHDATPPTKRRKLDDSDRPSRPPSPPWKKVAADGPTSFIVDGRRKSGRTNALPVERDSSTDKRRTTRHAASTNGHKATKAHSLKSTASPAVQSPSRSVQAKYKRASGSAQELEKPKANGTTRKFRHEPASTPNGSATRKSGRINDFAKAQANNIPNGHQTTVQSSPTSAARTPRLKLKLGPLQLPFLHPLNAEPPRKHSSFAEWLEQDDPLAGEDFRKITAEEARDEARLRLRILDAAQSGGVLSEGQCSKYAADAEEEPPPRYGPWNHIAAHAANFRKLLMAERRNHVITARRLAFECMEAWNSRQGAKLAKLEAERPKTKEEIEAQEKDYAEKRYKQLVKDIQQQWLLVRAEVDKRRQERWQQEQEKLGKQTMKSLLDQSTHLLKERRNRADSIYSSDMGEDSESYLEGDDGQEDEGEDGESRIDSTRPGSSHDVMDDESGSGSEEETVHDEDEDANLTQDQLREKYANLRPSEFGLSEEEYEDDGGGGETEEEERADNSLGLRSLLTNGTSAKDDDEATASTNDPRTDKNDLGGIDPSKVTLEEVDNILMDDEDDDSDMNMDSDDEGSATEEDDEDDEETEEDENDEDALGTWGFLSGQEIEELKKKAAQELESEKAATAESVADIGDDKEHEANGLELVTEKDVPLAEPSGTALDREPAAGNSVDGLLEAQSPPKDANMIDTAEGQQQNPEDISQGNNGELMADPVESPTTIKTPVPPLLRGKLRPYQHEGLDWLAGLYDGNTNGILADEMGLGKTIQTIALLAHLAVERQVWGPHLVVVPTSVMLNWEMEFKKFCPGFKVLAYYGSIEERKRKRQGWMNDDLWNVVITSYQLILHDAAAFKKRSWHYLILDEAHNIKNFQTQRWQTLLTFKTQRRLLLTGTPLQNNLQELWSLLFFLMPSGDDGQGGFAALSNFTHAMARPTNQILDQGRQELDAEAQATVKQLHEVLRPYLLRRLKADVEKQMPGKYEHVVYCRLSKRQRQLYDGFMGRADTRQTLAGGNYMSIMNCLMSLRKVCNHPDLFETRQIVTSFAMPKSVVADYEIKDLLVRKRLLQEDQNEKLDLDFLNLCLAKKEHVSAVQAKRIQAIQAIRPLEGLIERQTRRLKPLSGVDGSSLSSLSTHLAATSDQSTLAHLQNCLHITRRRAQRTPVYGTGFIDRITLNNLTSQFIASRGPWKGQNQGEWYLGTPSVWPNIVPTLDERSEALATTVQKFGFVTPAVVASDLIPLALGEDRAQLVRSSITNSRPDPYHESRIRLSIAFPDKRLLQYDCGKLQRLAKLLRDLQAGGHRALIFTQMTKVLDVLEQFLNIHGHRYLRLDGATKIEQRQVLTDRFNNDPRILAFILSSRSGGLGINLTGADTVIFYDLDWNPAMDKQCQDRCHRIGQTRDVHIYRFVSEYTIEANILRKSNQKRLLDDVIIQKGDFTTDYFNRLTYKDVLDEVPEAEDSEANAAMDKVLGNMGMPDPSGLGSVLEGVEDKEDTEAAKVAQKEIVTEVHIDDADFNEASSRPSATPRPSAPPISDGDRDLDGEEAPHVDDFMVRLTEWELRDVPLGPPPDRRRRKRNGGEHRIRRRR